MKLSENLKRIRKENHLSQEQLAEKLGVSRQAVSKWESGQSYPEMDKVLLICKLFDYKMDELMNENVKEVEETRQSKNNINQYIDEFFDKITKIVSMLSSMNWRQRLGCLMEQIMVGIVLSCILAILGGIGHSILIGVIHNFPVGVSSFIENILGSIYLILAFVVGITVFLHIFKIRYLDYYEIVKEEKTEDADVSEEPEKLETEKVLLEKKKEKIVIRDPQHSQSRFLTEMMKVILWGIKFVAFWFACIFAFSLIGFVMLFILSFLFVGTGKVFWGSLCGILGAIVINVVILELFYDFIASRKPKKSRMAISVLAGLVLIGCSIGMIVIGLTGFHYEENAEVSYEKEAVFETAMTENLSINRWFREVEFVETDSADVRVVVKHSKYYVADISEENETIFIHYWQDESKIMDAIRENIEDINHRVIKNYYVPSICVYASKENIEKMIQNERNKKEQEEQTKSIKLQEAMNEMEIQLLELEQEIDEKDLQIETLTEQVEQLEQEEMLEREM